MKWINRKYRKYPVRRYSKDCPVTQTKSVSATLSSIAKGNCLAPKYRLSIITPNWNNAHCLSFWASLVLIQIVNCAQNIHSVNPSFSSFQPFQLVWLVFWPQQEWYILCSGQMRKRAQIIEIPLPMWNNIFTFVLPWGWISPSNQAKAATLIPAWKNRSDKVAIRNMINHIKHGLQSFCL